MWGPSLGPHGVIHLMEDSDVTGMNFKGTLPVTNTLKMLNKIISQCPLFSFSVRPPVPNTWISPLNTPSQNIASIWLPWLQRRVTLEEV